jgi:glyoxylase-like metal-dependent hydrolase (beta-lactamase superfamily II)
MTTSPDLALGRTSVHRVIDLDPFALPFDMLLPGADPAALAPFRVDLAGHVDLDALQVLLAIQTHVVRVGGLTILVDTCVGEHKPRPVRPDWHQRAATGYLDRLAAAGARAEDVDIVLCTHLHADHVGWNTVLRDGRWVPTFPRARYVMGHGELAHWQAAVARDPTLSHGCFTDSVLPVVDAGLASPITPGDAIAEGALTLPLPGHTPGQIGLRLETGDRPVFFCGDAVHTPAQAYEPDWSSRFCTDREQAAVTRRALFERVVDEDAVLVPAHLRAAGMRLKRDGSRFRPTMCGCDGGC